MKICYIYRMTNLGYILKQDLITFLLTGTISELTGGTSAIGSAAATEGNDNIWKMQIPSAKEMMLGYTRHWYDMDTESRSYYEYSDTEACTEGQRVAGEATDDIRTLYLCIQDAPAGTELTNTDYFEETDDRNPILVEAVCILVIYNISRRMSPRQIPEQRQIDYDRIIDTLKDIQKGRIQLSIAEREEVTNDDSGQEIAFGDIDDVTQDIY